MKKTIITYESSSGVVHEGELYDQHRGVTKCGVYFSIRNTKFPRWYATNKEVACKVCRPVKKLLTSVDKNVAAFGIDTPEKATFATIRARLLSALETWEKHAGGKIDKERFDLDMRHDLRDIVTDLHEYKNRYQAKHWSHEKKRYVTTDKNRPVNRIKHNLDGKVPSYYSYKCCQSNTCKCGRKVPR